jgi:hypothetical protein
MIEVYCVTMGRGHCWNTLLPITSDYIRARMAKGATIPLDDISAKITYMMWHQEHHWNATELRRE